MILSLAIKAFLKAWKNPKSAQDYLEHKQKGEGGDISHLRLLGQLQHMGRLIDFLKEDISSYSDAEVGAAVRKIHADCGKCLEELVTVRPLMEEKEGSKIQLPKGYDSSKIKVIGNVKGDGPHSGTLIHKGWKAHKRSLPKKTGEFHAEVICPAEVEVR